MPEQEKPAEKTYQVEKWCNGIRVTDIALDLAYYGIRTKKGTSWFMLAEGNSPFDEDMAMPEGSVEELFKIAETAFPELKTSFPSKPNL